MSGNANSGRRPRPTALRLYEGVRGHHPLREDPRADPGIPPCPEDMPELGRQFWERAAQVLAQPGLIAQRDFAILELAARRWARAKACDAVIDRDGLEVLEITTQTDTSGTPVDRVRRREHPLLRVAAREWQAFHRALASLGLTPVDWARLSAPTRRRTDSLLTG